MLVANTKLVGVVYKVCQENNAVSILEAVPCAEGCGCSPAYLMLVNSIKYAGEEPSAFLQPFKSLHDLRRSFIAAYSM